MTFQNPPLTQPSSGRFYAIIAHLLIIPPVGVWGVLVLWLWKKNKSPEIDWHGKEALNFQITVWLASVVIGLLSWPLASLIGTLGVVLAIVAAIKAKESQRWPYPFALRLVD
jgi:hypothetical protein